MTLKVPWVFTGSATDPCCCTKCHDKYGDTLPVTTSGILTCGGCYTKDGNDYSVSLSPDVNSGFNVTWNALSLQWEANNGTLTVSKFASSDGTCAGLISARSANVPWFVTCLGDNQFSAQTPSINLFGYNWAVFAGAAPAGPSSPISNAYAITDCGFAGANPGAGYGGVITIDV